MTKKKTPTPGPLAAARAAVAAALAPVGHPVHTAPPATVSPPSLHVLDATPALEPGPNAGGATARFDVLALAAVAADAETLTGRVDELTDKVFTTLHTNDTIAAVSVQEIAVFTFADGQPYAGARLSVAVNLDLQEGVN